MENNTDIVKVGSKKPFIITICALVIVIASLVTYIFLNKDKDADKVKDDANKPKPSVKVDDEDEKNRDLTEDEKSSLMSMIKEYHLFDLVSYDKKVTFDKNNITNQMMLAFSYYADSTNEGDIPASKADVYFDKAFGFKDVEYKDILCIIDENPFYVYDNKAKNFKNEIEENHGHGWITVGFADYVIREAKKEGNEYKISVIFLAGGGESDYKVNNQAFETTLDTYQNSREEFVTEFRENISKYDDVKPLTFTFVKEDGNFHLKSIELEK